MFELLFESDVRAIACLREHRAIVMEEFIRKDVCSTPRVLRIRFELGRHERVPGRKTIKRWGVALRRNTGSALQSKPTGRPWTKTMPEMWCV